MAESKMEVHANHGKDFECISCVLQHILEEETHEKPLTTTAECLTRLLQKEDMCDVTLILRGGKQYKVHRLVLSMWSPVFKAMFFGPLSKDQDGIELPEEDPKEFKLMLDYMYSASITLPDVDTAIQISMLADKYQMDHLKSVCLKFLCSSVTCQSVPQIMNLATLLEDKSLILKCNQIIQRFPDEVFLSPSIGSLSPGSLDQLLDEEIPVSSEAVIFQGLLTWGHSQLKGCKENITNENIRPMIESYLPKVRFLSMSIGEFLLKVLPEYILTREELTPISQKIIGKEEVTIPKICSNIEIPRRFHISNIKSAVIRFWSSEAREKGSISYEEGEERLLLSEIKSNADMLLKELEYCSEQGDKGKLIAKDFNGQQIGEGDFDGRIAKFNQPLKLNSKIEYSFFLKGIKKSVKRRTIPINDCTYSVITGNLEDVQSSGGITCRYWK